MANVCETIFASSTTKVSVPRGMSWPTLQVMYAAIPASTLTLVPDAGHLIQLDAPVALATELRRWLAVSRLGLSGMSS